MQQLSYDGKRIDGLDRYVFLGQFLGADGKKCWRVLAVKSFCDASVTCEVIFEAIVDETCTSHLNKVYSVMADSTSLNSGEKSGINKRLVDYFHSSVGHDIHTLECMFHVNEIYFSHMLSAIEGKTKGPGAMQEGALLNKIKSIHKPRIADIVPRHVLSIPVTAMAQVHIKAKAEWFSEQKSKGLNDGGFRSDQMCLLVLACYIITDVPENLKYLLEYKQEETSHARWIMTANVYLRSGGLRRKGGLLGSKFQNAVVCTKAHHNRYLIGSYARSANQASSFNACNVETSFTASNW